MADARTTRNKRVCNALPLHYERLRTARELRGKLKARDAGSLYPGLKGVVYQDLLNLIQQARLALEISLSATCPRFLATTQSEDENARNFANKFGRALNRYMPQIGMRDSLQTIVGEAFISLGIGKAYLADSAPIFLEADNFIIPGKPYFSPRNIDHFVWDQNAIDFRYSSFFSDRYQATLELVASDTRVPGRLRDKIIRTGASSIDSNAVGEETFNQKPTGSEDAVVPWTYLADVYLPSEKLIQTYAVGDGFRPVIEEPLYEIEWAGRPLGPYHFLNLGPVPNSTIPSSPAQNSILLHSFVNTIWRKLKDGVERQKQVTVGKTGNEDDNEALRNATTGDHLCLTDPEIIKELNLGGIDQQIYSVLVTATAAFDRSGNNVQARLGAGPSAPTAKQEGMIGNQVSRLEGHYQTTYKDFVTDVGRELGAMLYEDAVTEIPMSIEIPNTGFYVEDNWVGAFEDGARIGDFNLYDIDMVPYSGAYRPPQEKLAALDAVVNRLMPLEPLLNQRGKALNVDKLLDLNAEYGDLTELRDLYEDITPPDQDGSQRASLLSGASDREYTHVNVNGSAPADPMQEMLASVGGG